MDLSDLGGAVVVASFAAFPLGLSVWALLDAARRPQWAWALAERRQVVWMAGIMFGVLTVVGGLLLSTWYLTRVRHEIAAAEDGHVPTRRRSGGPEGRAAMSSGSASRLTGMEAERVTASTTIEAAPEAVFAVLADPSAHAEIDGTGWVRGSLDGDRITAVGQVFRVAMYHEDHPDKDYEIANRVEVFDEPRAIAWQPGTESPETGELSFGGWIWRYDLEGTDPSRTTVTLTYDWSAVLPQVREYLQFPPFGPDHLESSLQHLSDLVA